MKNRDKFKILSFEGYYAESIMLWRYQCPYTSEYLPSEGYLAQFLNSLMMFHTIIEPIDDHAGFFFSVNGHVLSGNYEENALDIGFGVRRELPGKSRGSMFFHTILSCGEVFDPVQHRLGLPILIKRLCIYTKNFDFKDADQIYDFSFEVPYTILMRHC